MAAQPERSGRFGRWIAIGSMLAGLAAMLAVLPGRGVGSAQAERPLRVVVHINFAKATDEKLALSNVENILKAAVEDGLKAEVEIVCHGDGIRLVEKARTESAVEVAGLINQGVRFVACLNTMRQRTLGQGDLLPGVGTVPSGAYEIVRKQQEGYSYFKP
jgi:intracellular sulfur oxidation DsrE/DsrF family protein